MCSAYSAWNMRIFVLAFVVVLIIWYSEDWDQDLGNYLQRSPPELDILM